MLLFPVALEVVRGAGRSGAAPQDGAAARQVQGLARCVARAAQVDQVEVGALDEGSAQVGAAQVGLADLLGRLEALLEELVGVEAGARALAGVAACLLYTSPSPRD